MPGPDPKNGSSLRVFVAISKVNFWFKKTSLILGKMPKNWNFKKTERKIIAKRNRGRINQRLSKNSFFCTPKIITKANPPTARYLAIEKFIKSKRRVPKIAAAIKNILKNFWEVIIIKITAKGNKTALNMAKLFIEPTVLKEIILVKLKENKNLE